MSQYQSHFTEFVNASASTALALDFSKGLAQAIPLTAASCAFTVGTAPKYAAFIVLRVLQDATGGRVFTVPGSFTGSFPTPAAGANAETTYLLYYNGTNYRCVISTVAAGVTSFISRVGAISAALNDYAASLINNDSGVTGATTKDALNTLKASITALVTGVSTVFGRSGTVVATAGDYAASKINNDSSTVSGTHVSDALDALKALIVASVTGVSTVFGRSGTVAAALNDYAASLIQNDSGVSGTTVKAALDALKAVLTALAASTVPNDSSVVGTTVKDALNTLKTSITALVTGVSTVFGRAGAVAALAGDYVASKINNDSSTVSGTHVSDALDALKALILALVASSIGNDSSVSGTKVKDALNTLNTALGALVTGVSSVFARTGAIVAVAGDYPATKINNDSVSVPGTHVSDALDNLLLQYVSVQAPKTTSYTFVLSDVGTLIPSNATSSLTFTIPANATTAIKIGSRISVQNINTGAVIINGAVGVTVRGPSLLPATQFTVRFDIEKTGTNTWLVTAVGALNSSDITNVSTVAGGTVGLALQQLDSDITNLTSNDIANFSTVTAVNVSDALDVLKAETYVGDFSVSLVSLDGIGWTFSQTTGWQANGGGDIHANPIGPIPVGRNVIGFKVRISPPTSHGANLPAVMPTLGVYVVNGFGAVTALGSSPVTDPSASVAAYEAPHDIVCGGFVLNGLAESFFFILTSENGLHAASGTTLVSATMTLAP